jgi:hypothetical protein
MLAGGLPMVFKWLPYFFPQETGNETRPADMDMATNMKTDFF